MQQPLGTAQPQEKVLGSSSVQQTMQVENTLIYAFPLKKSGMFQHDNPGVLAGGFRLCEVT